MSSQRSPTNPRAVTKRQRKASVSAPADPFAPSEKYYGDSKSHVSKARTYSEHDPFINKMTSNQSHYRRGSHDPKGNVPLKYRIKVKETLRNLTAREDTNQDGQITIMDGGPKVIQLATKSSDGLRRFDVRGTYMLSNLLQELTIADDVYKLDEIELDEARLNENPVHRLSRKIRDEFWRNLERRIDGSNIKVVAKDTKVEGLDPRPRIYVPIGAPKQHEYYTRISAELAAAYPNEPRLDVRSLPKDPTDPRYVRDLNDYPGLLAIEMEPLADTPKGEPDFRGLPFVVPGGRFNELYGWDSYMETLGLLIDGKPDLCESMVKHFCFCIQHYGKILNANRTYYLCRSQPPFLTDMALRVFDHIKDMKADSADFLKRAMLAAIKDYYITWTAEPRYDPVSHLSCYRPDGVGVPPETEASHFVHILTPYAKKHKMTFEKFVEEYNQQRISEPELDEYFRHDRSIRESGHDTSYRLENVSADLATVDLNSCLYKYEIDIARTIRFFFGDRLEIPAEWHVKGKSEVETSSTWEKRAKERRKRMNDLMWNEESGMFFDYNVVKKEQTGYESVTTFWAMWAGAATPAQAATMVRKALPLFEKFGGLTASTEKSRGEVGLERPNRQWDYPNGWAPQQILAWTGLLRYGFEEDAQRLAYRWIYMCTKAFMDYNGVVVEKYNVTKEDGAHDVDAEYGNQGANFKGGPTEGFGWVNASYVYGLQIVNEHMKRALSVVTPWWTFYQMTNALSAKEAEEIRENAMKNNSTAHGATMPIAQHAFGAASTSPSLAHSHEDEAGHKATHGAAESKTHHGPGQSKSGGAH